MHDQDQLGTLHERSISGAQLSSAKPCQTLRCEIPQDHSQVLLDQTGAPKQCCLLACEYIADVHNACADKTLRYHIPHEVQHGGLQHISAFLEYCFYEKIFYLDFDQSFPFTKEK